MKPNRHPLQSARHPLPRPGLGLAAALGRRVGLLALVGACVLGAGASLARDDPPRVAKGLAPTGNPLFDAAVERYVKNETPKVVGGQIAGPGAYPWQVSLGAAAIRDPVRAHFCGGSIVDQNWVRTAAHCVQGLTPDRIKVASGSDRLTTKTERTPVKSILIHRDYNKPVSHDNDVALLRLSRPLALDGRQQSIALAAPDRALTAGQLLEVSGWGATREGGGALADLRFAKVPYVTNRKCNDPLSYGGRVTANMLCAGLAQGGLDSCQGDSGGPLVDRSTGTPVQVGIVSWGEGCAEPGRYGVYADGRRYQAWEAGCISRPDDCR